MTRYTITVGPYRSDLFYGISFRRNVSFHVGSTRTDRPTWFNLDIHKIELEDDSGRRWNISGNCKIGAGTMTDSGPDRVCRFRGYYDTSKMNGWLEIEDSTP